MPVRQRILIVDDAPANIKLLAGMLGHDYGLASALSGEEALEILAHEIPDLVLLDIMMPGMDGYEVCRRLKEDLRLRHVPVIFVTAMGDFEAESMGLKLGAADYITKPINVVLARQRIRNLLEREQLRKKVEIHRDQLEAEVAERTLSLSIAKEAAEAANKAKSVFLSKMSHELRTPMNAILGMTEVVKRNSTEPQTIEQLKKISRASQQLLAIINDILDMSKIESEQLSLVPIDFKLCEVLQNMVALTAKRVQDKGLTLTSHIAPDLYKLLLRGDPQRLGQILHNLISNAIKFTASGAISLHISQIRETHESILVCFKVTDNGIGVSVEDQKRIFTTFEQVDASTTRKYGGTGLGLALCKRLVHLMGGDIGVESQIGSGSTFWFTIRLAKSKVPETHPG